MTFRFMKLLAVMLAVLLCVSTAGCARSQTPQNTGTQPYKPILPGATGGGSVSTDRTAVYVSVFRDLAILSAYPVLEYEGEKPLCDPREISSGGSIRCGGYHEQVEPITRVLIAGELVPQAMNDWFRGLVYLESIQGLENVRTHHVENMSHLFAGCERINAVNVEDWDVSAVTDMTGIFDGCAALAELPDWYASDRENMD